MPDFASLDARENAAAMNRLYGKTVLWIGAEAQHMDTAAVVAAAKQARLWGVDTICIKKADGGIPWFASNEALQAEAAAVRAEGCGYLPFIYCYGPKFPVKGEAFPGEMQVRAEVALAVRMAEHSGGSVQLDMEAEYNGAVQCAELVCALLRPVPITVSVSTWADPLIQNWKGVAAALAPCVNAWTPQRYTDWLAEQAPLPEQTCIQPGVDITAEFGADHPVAIAGAHPCVFVWEWRAIANNANWQIALHQIVHRGVAAAAAAPSAAPAAPSVTPAAPSVTPAAPSVTPAAPSVTPAAPSVTPAAPSAPTPSHTVMVEPWPGPLSTLWGIAEAEWGDAELWPAIADANPQSVGPNGWVAAHTELLIPERPNN